MSKKRKKAGWEEVRRECGLTPRQVDQAKDLQMDPRKVLSLRPSKDQPWKKPVGDFIEDLHYRRFGNESLFPPPESSPDWVPLEPEPRVRDFEEWPAEVASDVQCFLGNLTDDVGRALASGAVTPEALSRLGEVLCKAGVDLLAGRSPRPVPPLVFEAGRDECPSREEDWSPDDIPF